MPPVKFSSSQSFSGGGGAYSRIRSSEACCHTHITIAFCMKDDTDILKKTIISNSLDLISCINGLNLIARSLYHSFPFVGSFFLSRLHIDIQGRKIERTNAT